MGMPFVFRSIDGQYFDLSAPTITDFTGAQHDHGDADDGGQLDWDLVWADAVHSHASDAEGGLLDWDTAFADSVHDHSSAAEGGTVLVLTDGALILPQAAVPPQTTEGFVVWDTDNDLLTVGTGAGRKTMADTDSTQTLAGKVLTAPAIADFTNANHTHAAGAGGGLLDWDTCWTDAVHSHQSNAEGGALDGAAITTTITGTGNVVKATGPTVTTLTVASGGLTVSAGTSALQAITGTTLNLSGAATLAAISGTTLGLSGAATLAAITGTTLSLSSTLTMTAAASQIVPGATSFAVRNNANTANNLIITDAGAATIRAGLTVTAGGLTVSAGTSALQAITGTTLNLSGAATLAAITGSTLTLNGASNNAYRVENTTPAWLIKDTDAGVDEKVWRFAAGSTQLHFQTQNDAESAFNTWLLVARAGAAVASAARTGSLSVSNGLTVSAGTSALQAITGTTLGLSGNVSFTQANPNILATATNSNLYIKSKGTGQLLLNNDDGGDVLVGGGTLATTATKGFIAIPTCLGAPTGAASEVGWQPMIYDQTNNRLYIRNGGTWRSAAFA